LFGGSWEVTGAGLTGRGGLAGSDFNTYLNEKKDGGWFRSDKHKTTVKDAVELENTLGVSLTNSLNQIDEFANRLGYDLSDSFSYAFNLSTKGLSEQKISEKLSAKINEIFNRAIAESGLDALSDAFGGFEQFQSAFNNFVLKTTSEAESIEQLNDSVLQVFSNLNLSIPDTLQGFEDLTRAMLETASGNEQTIKTLLGMTDAMVAYYDLMEVRQKETEARQKELNDQVLDSWELFQAYQALKTSLTMYQAALSSLYKG
jgi:hypothetical protein